jgi:hypothetical protein
MFPHTGITFAPGHPAPKRIQAGRLFAMLAVAAVNSAIGAESAAATTAPPIPAEADPWAFNLNLYTWLPGVDGKFSVGPLNRSVDKTFIDIVDASHSFPLGFMGRFEARYERFGLYLDGVWFDLDFKRKTGPRGFASVGLETEMGILDYGVMYRVSGPPDLANWNGTSGPNRLDLYAGARTIWLDNTLTPQRLRSVSASKTLTSPVIGGRVFVDFGRDWFVKIDGNIGGFGADNVDFTGGILGSLGYRTTLFDAPTAFELGYKALRIEVSDKAVATRATLNGPFLGVTAFW